MITKPRQVSGTFVCVSKTVNIDGSGIVALAMPGATSDTPAPSGQCQMTILNAEALAAFIVGQVFTLRFEPVLVSNGKPTKSIKSTKSPADHKPKTSRPRAKAKRR